MPTFHRDDVEPSAIHPAAFVGGTDPSLDVDNHVAAHKLWIDTSGSTFKIKKRDAGNATWEIVASLTHADLTGLGTGDPHTQYLLKSLATTKGDILVATAAGTWVRLPAGVDGYALVSNAAATEGVGWASLASLAGAHVIQDNGSDMAQEPLLDFVGFTLTDVPGTPGTTRVTNPSVGTVTSVAFTAAPAGIFDVAGSPIVGSGTIALSMDNQTANKMLASPASGGAAAPAFRALVAADLPTNTKRMSIAFQFGDGVNAIDSSTEREQWLELNFDCTIEGYSLTADAVGSIVVDLWYDTYANYPPTVADTITASAKPTLSSANKAQDITLTGWTTALARGGTLKAHVNSAGTVKAVTLTLYVIKT